MSREENRVVKVGARLDGGFWGSFGEVCGVLCVVQSVTKGDFGNDEVRFGWD